MIGVIFEYGDENLMVQVNGNNLIFSDKGGSSTIEGLRLDKYGVVKEFPDLKDNMEWKKIAIERFKEKIKSIPTERGKINYIIEDLKKFGYKAKFLQQSGMRVQKL